MMGELLFRFVLALMFVVGWLSALLVSMGLCVLLFGEDGGIVAWIVLMVLVAAASVAHVMPRRG